VLVVKKRKTENKRYCIIQDKSKNFLLIGKKRKAYSEKRVLATVHTKQYLRAYPIDQSTKLFVCSNLFSKIKATQIGRAKQIL